MSFGNDVTIVVLPYMGKPKDKVTSIRDVVAKHKRRMFVVMTDLDDAELSIVTERTQPADPFELLALKELINGRATNSKR